ncbi:MAG: hypothetical protein F6J90_23350 [Moorea sp. SIOASIH]|uniref:hypothetical protein n=1 Tax=Moorena sp. SIOASIH TaxID=2607817 RepID=UPI0013BB59E3|nr:hypothetical protein [Moorena sp. SIOASIH]NEO39111.1 hypothetical protein [Moorena sp. SIOASIH]
MMAENMMTEHNLGEEALNSLTNTNNPMFKKVGADLTLLSEEYKDYLETFTFLPFQSNNQLLQVSNSFVVIDAVAVGDTTTLLKDLEELGLQQGSMYGSVVSGVLPIQAIEEMGSLDSLNFAKPAYRPITNIGLTTTQGQGCFILNFLVRLTSRVPEVSRLFF